MKKFLSILFATMLVGQVWAYDFRSGSLYYTITSSSEPYTVAVAGGESNTVIIPDTVSYDGNKYAVTSISANAFNNCSDLKSVTIPNTVTRIGESAFSNCRSLTAITIPNSVTYVERYAFSGFSSNQKIFCITTSSSWAFYWYTGATVVYGAKYVDDYVCRITSNDPYTIELSGYFGDDSILKIPEKITIDKVEYSVTSIGSSAFDGYDNLLSVSMSDSITSIGDNAFYNCSRLSSINIPSSVTSIGKNAFCNCTSLKSVTIPNSVTSIGEYAFKGSSSSLFCVATSKPSGWDLNWNYGKEAVWGAKFVGDLVYHITNSDPCTAEISGYFGNAAELDIPEKVTINSIEYDVTSISSNAFYGVTNINYLGNAEGSPWGAAFVNHTIEGDFVYSDAAKTTLVKYMGKDNAVVIPGNVTSIKSKVFEGYNGLTAISIPNSVTIIDDDTFRGCDSLKSIVIESDANFSNTSLFFNIDGIRYKLLNKNSVEVAPDVYSGQITIPESVTIGNTFVVTSIGYAFSNCRNITSVILPETITDISREMFDKCYGLQYNEYNNACYLGSKNNRFFALIYAISSEFITSCEVNNNCKVIASYAFKNNSYLKSITIPKSVEYINQLAIYGESDSDCRKVFCITANKPNGWQDGWASTTATVVWGAKFVDDYVCQITDTLQHEVRISGFTGDGHVTESFDIPEKLKISDNEYTVTSIGNSAFNSCLLWTDYKPIVIIPNTVKSIGPYAFKDCRFGTIVIPGSVTSIMGGAFSCNATFYCESKRKPDGWVDSNYDYGDQWVWNNNTGRVVWGAKVVDGVVYHIKYNDSYDAEIIDCIKSDTALAIPEKVTIDNTECLVASAGAAFENCRNLTSVTIGSDADFSNSNLFFTKDSICYRILSKNTVEVAQLREYYSSVNWYTGSLYSGKIIIPETVTAGNTFSVMGIGKQAFYGCGGLTSVIIPNSITSIREQAFYGCGNLTSVIIPNSITSIGEQAFYGCGKLTSIYIPKSVASIGQYAFGGNITINCENSSKPEDWNDNWNDGCIVVWANSNTNPGTAVAESAADNLQVYAHHNTIIVENATEEIRVYNAMGRLVVETPHCDVSTEIRVNTTGVYIVKIGNVAKRVIVN